MLLRVEKEVFAWKSTDMIGVPRVLGEHRLHIAAKEIPVIQNKRPITPARSTSVNKEVDELASAKILSESVFPTWVAKPVLVKKGDGSLIMCVDFTSLNKAFLMDAYPLPEIEQKVKSLEAFRWKSFLDAYKGYHQIQMAKVGKDKTAFHIERGNLYYTRMSFDHRSAGETYQRLVDQIFKD